MKSAPLCIKPLGNLVSVKIYDVNYGKPKPTIIVLLCTYKRMSIKYECEIMKYKLLNVIIIITKNFWKASGKDP